MTTIPSDGSLGARPASPVAGAAPPLPSLNPSSIPAPLSSSTDSTKTSTAPSPSVLTPPGAVSDGYPTSGPHAGHSHSSQPGGQSLYYAGHMTGSWPTPGLSQPSAYTYGHSSSGASGPGSLAQPPYHRAPASYGSAPSPSHQHFPGRASSSAPNGESIPAPQSYQDQQSFSSPVGVGGPGSGRGGGLGSPLNPQGGNQQSGLAQPMLSNPAQTTAHQGPGQSTPGGGPVTTQDGGSYRPPVTAAHYYPQTSAPQQPSFPSYASPVTQPSPTSALSASSSGSIPRAAIPAMAPPLQYPAGRGHPVPSMGSYASYNPVPGPVLSNMHHPGAPLTMVTGMSGLPNYSHHPGMPPHHPHSLYLHHPGGPAPQSERPFKCDICQQAFNRNHDLKRHQRIHLAVKPFGCGDCEKRFSRKDALKRHRLVKGCGGTSPLEGPKTATGGNEGASDDRGVAVGGDRDGSPRSIKKDL
ncbi:hypothetical protein C8A01DRAFT_43305 [Parachaetomium inaequale]|uniref:C2H2-type domain-containing protein n=1 Tax=Parachaetomium inaequale TaxID=2588326 RepID=A0AAN6PMK5_9PEZI|nr:hypothetical protein C8A01DRAFT_43305 [Parachaetomium inaequale]